MLVLQLLSPVGSLRAGMFSLIDGVGAGEDCLGSGHGCRSDSGLSSPGALKQPARQVRIHWQGKQANTTDTHPPIQPQERACKQEQSRKG